MRICALLFCALLITGCGVFGKKDGSEPMELVDIEQTVRLKTLWSRSVGKGQGVGYTRLVPAIDGDQLFAADHQGRITALERATGKRNWQVKTRESLSGGISSRGGVLLYGTFAGQVVALDNTNGEELWRTQLSGEIMSVPRASDSVVAVQTMNGRIYALDRADGRELWSYDNPPPVLTLRGTASPVVTDSAIFAGFSNGKIMAFNPRNGLVLWEQRVALPQGRSELERMIDIDASPILRDGVVYVGSYQGRVAAYNRATGRGIWAADSSTHEEMALRDNVLYVSQADSRITAFDANSGTLLWDNEQLLRRRVTGPQVFGDYLAVADFKGYLHVMQSSDGEFVARRRLDRKGVRAPLLSADGVLYVYGNRGRLYALTAEPR